MVRISLMASDAMDSFLRFWGISIDKVPAPGPDWRTDSSMYVEKHRSGETMSIDVDMTDGDHKVYVIISQDGGTALGTYSGTVSIGGKQSNFNGVDDSTAYAFVVTVKGGVVTSESSSSAGTSKSGLTNDINKAKDWISKHKVVAGILFGLPVIGTVIAVAVGKRGNGHF